MGPSIAGLLIQLVTAPFAIIIDALSFLGSAAFLARIHTKEPAPLAPEQRPAVWSHLLAGARFILHHPILRSFLASLATFNFFSYVIRALYVLRILGVSPVLLGVIYATGSIGFPLGALFAGPVAKSLGMGPTIIWGAGLSNAAYLLLILAHGSLAYVVPMLIAAQMFVSFPSAITAINQSSLRQVSTPNEMRGRANGASLFLASGLGTFGGLITGILGQALGLQNTLIIAIIGIQLGTVILLISPFRRFREPPPFPQTVC